MTPVTPAAAAEDFATWAARSGYSPASARLYTAKVRAFCAWLEEQGAEYDGALTDEHLRDYAVRDYRRMLLSERKQAVATVEASMSALTAFYGRLGLGKPKVTRQSPPRGGPKSLSDDELRKVLRAAERRGLRDYALTVVLAMTAVRVDEAHLVDTDDVFVSERLGRLDVRHGKGGLSRQVPIPAEARPPLRDYLAWRRERYGPEVGPLFVARTGGRLSVRRVQSLMATIGAQTGTDLHPHVLRHTYARRFLEAGGDLAALQEQLGHKNLSSTQVYTRPTAAGLAAANDRMTMPL